MRNVGNDKGIAAQHSGQFIIYECVDMELFLVFIMATLRCPGKVQNLVGSGTEKELYECKFSDNLPATREEMRSA